MRKIIFTSALLLAIGPAVAQLDSTTFNTTPDYVDTFAGGNPVFEWEIDPIILTFGGGSLAGVQEEPLFTTTTLSTSNSALSTADPVASTDGALVVGNQSADSGTHFGLHYLRASNSEAGGTGDDFTSLVNYKVEADVFLLGSDILPSEDRWQVGPYVHTEENAESLFRAGVFYNRNSTGGGPGAGWRGFETANGTLDSAAAIATSDFRTMSVLIDGDSAAVGFDANGDGTIDESDPAEFNGNLARDTVDAAFGAPGFFTVGDVSQDVLPMYVDELRLYLPVPPSDASNWTLY